MKQSSLLFVASLVVNAVLLGWFLHLPSGAASSANPSAAGRVATEPGGNAGKAEGGAATKAGSSAMTTGPSAMTTGPSAISVGAAAITEAFKRQDAAGLLDQLRSLGLPEETIRSVVLAMLRQRVHDRYNQLVALHKDDKSDLLRGGSYTRNFSREERTELRKLNGSVGEEMLKLFGSSVVSPEFDNLNYGYLPGNKGEQLKLLNRDYADMRMDLNNEIAGFRMPGDEEKLKLLDQEKRRDLEAMLTPAELAEYDLRNSSVAASLRSRLAKLTVSDDEFRRLYAVLKDASDVAPLPDFRQSGGKITPEQIEQMRNHQTAVAASQDELKAILGEQRFAEYQRSNETDYRQLQAAATRFNLPQDTVEKVYGLRAAVSAQSLAIGANAGLGDEQKKQALAALATQTRDQVRTALGPEIGDAYLKNSMRWLERVENGRTVTFTPGGGSRFMPVTKTSAPKPAPAVVVPVIK